MTSKQAVTATAGVGGVGSGGAEPTRAGRGPCLRHQQSRVRRIRLRRSRAGGPPGELLRELEQAAASFSALDRHAFAHALVGWSSGESARWLGVVPKGGDNALQCARRKLGGSGMSGKRPEPGRAPSTVTARASGTASCQRPV
jgi:hypothetical protein